MAHSLQASSWPSSVSGSLEPSTVFRSWLACVVSAVPLAESGWELMRLPSPPSTYPIAALLSTLLPVTLRDTGQEELDAISLLDD